MTRWDHTDIIEGTKPSGDPFRDGAILRETSATNTPDEITRARRRLQADPAIWFSDIPDMLGVRP